MVDQIQPKRYNGGKFNNSRIEKHSPFFIVVESSGEYDKNTVL